MNVLVTGGAGYVGSHAAKFLASSGHRPVVIDDLSTGHNHNVKWGPLIQANLSDRTVVRRVLQEHKIEAVIHFAGSALVAESATQPLVYFENNVAGTLGLLEAMRGAGIRDIVFSSSSRSTDCQLTPRLMKTSLRNQSVLTALQSSPSSVYWNGWALLVNSAGSTFAISMMRVLIPTANWAENMSTKLT